MVIYYNVRGRTNHDTHKTCLTLYYLAQNAQPDYSAAMKKSFNYFLNFSETLQCKGPSLFHFDERNLLNARSYVTPVVV